MNPARRPSPSPQDGCATRVSSADARAGDEGKYQVERFKCNRYFMDRKKRDLSLLVLRDTREHRGYGRHCNMQEVSENRGDGSRFERGMKAFYVSDGGGGGGIKIPILNTALAAGRQQGDLAAALALVTLAVVVSFPVGRPHLYSPRAFTVAASAAAAV